MKIAVNTRLLLPDRLDGIGRFAYETLRHITMTHPEHEFIFIFDREYHSRFIFSDNITPVVTSPQARHPLLFLAWFELSLPYIFKQYQPDIFFSPDGYLSLSAKVPSVAVMHDLNFEHFPKDLPFATRNYYRQMFPRFARKARRIATVSEYSKMDISEKYGISADKIDVVYNGSSEVFKPLDAAEQERTRIRFTAGSEYFIFVGSLHPRKNLVNLFAAFDLFKQSDAKGIKLVLAGARMWWTDDMRVAYETMEYKNDVIFTGRVSDVDLSKLLASSLSLTYVSYFEGFGIPILEAFQCETPVLTSNVTSMPEVAGNAAVLVDPFDVEAIAKAMLMLASDESSRMKLIEQGRSQRELYSWEKTAKKVWNTIESSFIG